MFTFTCEQKEVKIGDVAIGGQPGVNPTTCFGTLFFGKKYAKLDEATIKMAREKLNEFYTQADKTSVNAIVDIYIKDEERVEKIIDFILDETKKPFSIDISDAVTRVKTLKYLGSQNALDRVIYNSLNLGITENEYTTLLEDTPKCVVALAFNPKDSSVDGKLEVLETGAQLIKVGEENKSILGICEEAGIKDILVDTAATPFGSKASETIRALPVLKSELGYPVGCAIHNTLESWNWMKEYKTENPDSYWHADTAVNAMIPALSGDFVFFGPVDAGKNLFSAIAFTDKLMAEGASDYFGLEINPNHPFYKLE